MLCIIKKLFIFIFILIFKKFTLIHKSQRKENQEQWWILGEANEAVASGHSFTVIEGPPSLKMPHEILFCGILHRFIKLSNSQKFGVVAQGGNVSNIDKIQNMIKVQRSTVSQGECRSHLAKLSWLDA